MTLLHFTLLVSLLKIKEGTVTREAHPPPPPPPPQKKKKSPSPPINLLILPECTRSDL